MSGRAGQGETPAVCGRGERASPRRPPGPGGHADSLRGRADESARDGGERRPGAAVGAGLLAAHASAPLVYHALVEVGPDGAACAHVAEVPGCFARGRNRAGAMEKLRPALAAFLGWLRGLGEPAPAPGQTLTLRLGEEISSGANVRRCELRALFEHDRTRLDPAEIERALRIMAHSREALLRSLEGLGPGLLDRIDPMLRHGASSEDALSGSGETVRASSFPLALFADEAPGTIRESLFHIARTEAVCGTRLAPTPEDAERQAAALLSLTLQVRDPFQLLEDTRNGFVARIAHLDPKALDRVATIAGERWTPRKVIRRALFHERLHACAIARMRVRIERRAR